MDWAKPAPTPIVKHIDYSVLEDSTDDVRQASSEKVQYRDLMRILLYLSTITRPAIMFSVNFLSSFMETPSQVH